MQSMASYSHLKLSHAFGFHRENHFLYLAEGFDHKRENAKVVRGWIPILGTIAAIFKLRAFSNPNAAIHEYSDEYRKGYAIRACIELFSLGFLLIIPDLIFTLHRAPEERAKDQATERAAREYARIYRRQGLV